MSLLDDIKRGKRLTAEFLYDLLYGLANGDLFTANNNLPAWRNSSMPDYVVSGCTITADSAGVNRNASMSAGTVLIDGALIDISPVVSRTYTASKDTYVDVDATATITYTEVANNAASPSLATGRIRLGVVVTGATTIAASTSINQGQFNRTVPTTCNLGLSGTDSLGNRICLRKPYKPLTYFFGASLQGTGDITIATIPLVQDGQVGIVGSISARYGGAPPDVQTNGVLYWDGTIVMNQRIDVQSNPATTSYPLGWQGETTAGSRVLKINTSTNAGALSHIEYAFRVEIW